MAITYYAEEIKIPAIKKRIVNNWIKTVVEYNKKEIGEVTYIFCSDSKILEINRQYLNHDYFTDIITFDYTEKNKISGDIFISLETVKSNAKKFETTYFEELHRIIIHGILHLCGIKDKKPDERKIMEEHENEALKLLPRDGYNF